MRLFRTLLRLLPREMRQEYEEELLDTTQRLRADLGDDPGPVRLAAFWAGQSLALIRAAATVRGPAPRSGAVRVASRLDLRHAVRALRTRPAFTAVATLTLALGVGATTAMFSVLHAVLLRPLPYDGADDAFVIVQTDRRDGSTAGGVSVADLADIRTRAGTLLDAGVAESHGLRLLIDGRAVSLRAWLVSEGFLAAAGARLAQGRAFLPEEYVDGQDRVVLLAHHTWVGRFGGDPSIVGSDIVLDGSRHTVVGILDRAFAFPDAAEVWGPRPVRAWDGDSRGTAGGQAIARRRPGSSIESIQSELERIAEELAATFPVSNRDVGFRALTLRTHQLGAVTAPLWLLFAAVLLLLLIAAGNLAGLQMARAITRQRELAVRTALGADRSALLRLLGAEALVLALLGGAAGWGIALLGTRLIATLAPRDVPRLDEASMNGTVFAVAMAVTLTTALCSSWAPTTGTLRARPTRGESRGASRGRDRLVVAQISLALVLSIGAGLLARSFAHVLDRDLGFDPADRLAAQVWAYHDDHTPNLEYFERGRAALAELPGVRTVGLTTHLPLAADRSILARARSVVVRIPGEERAATAWLSQVSPDLPEALGLEPIRGRTFHSGDDQTHAPVALVNETFARRYLATGALGRSVTPEWRSGRAREIVGVLPDLRPEGFESEPRPEVYVPLAQEPANGLTFVVDATRDAGTLVGPVRQTLWTVDPTQAVWGIRPIADLAADWNRDRRFAMSVLSGFALLALLLAGVGIYGVVSFSVERRTAEIGVRRALGGGRRDIYVSVLRRAARLAGTGVLIGMLLSAGLSRWVTGLLYGVSPLDPWTFLGLSAVVVVVALVAALGPAHRAARVDPLEALRGSVDA